MVKNKMKMKNGKMEKTSSIIPASCFLRSSWTWAIFSTFCWSFWNSDSLSFKPSASFGCFSNFFFKKTIEFIIKSNRKRKNLYTLQQYFEDFLFVLLNPQFP